MMSVDSLPDSAVKKAKNLVRDSRLATLLALIPVLGLIYILRLVQWYLLKRQFPILASADAGEHAELSRDFRLALARLWFAVFFWPVLVGFLLVYSLVT
jgi:hypothetical protein